MKIKNLVFRTIIEPDYPRGYHGFVPLLPGLHTCGDTIDEVRKNLREAIICHVQGLTKDKKPIPQEGEAMEVVQVFNEKELKPLYA